ncbi:MAG: B12-binding domain-containing radical SAM protein [Candidatus Hydrogenedentes bacterium]|nr:B12-binding domain-containing radical SAM protein [Candidatus Hydrogenedentota bacterium]
MIVLTEIVIPPDEVYGVKYPPLALACLSTALKEAGRSCRIVTFEADHQPEAWVNHVLSLNPSVVGFSVFMGYKLEKAFRLTRLLKQKRPDVPILWGGVHPSLCPEQTLVESDVDWVCVGNGESTMVAIARALDGEISLDEVPSLVRRVNGNIVTNPPGLPRRDETYARPDWKSFPVQDFIIEAGPGERILGFMSSRGCPYQCGFCYIKAYYGRRWKGAELDAVQKEMLYLRDQYGVTGFIFLDDLFFANKKRAVELLRWMAAERLSCHAVDLRLSEVDREVLETLRLAKTKGVFIGVESANDRVLKVMTKGSGTKELHEAMNLLNEYPDLLLWLSCIVGVPTETFEEMNETITVAARLSRRPNTMVNLNTFIPLQGTGLYELSLEHGFRAPTNLEGWTKLSEARGNTLDHFPGRLTPAQTRYIQRAAHYLRMLYRPYPVTQRNPVKRAIVTAFRQLAAFRLEHQTLAVPVDMWLYRHLRQMSQSLKRQEKSPELVEAKV